MKSNKISNRLLAIVTSFALLMSLVCNPLSVFATNLDSAGRYIIAQEDFEGGYQSTTTTIFTNITDNAISEGHVLKIEQSTASSAGTYIGTELYEKSGEIPILATIEEGEEYNIRFRYRIDSVTTKDSGEFRIGVGSYSGLSANSATPLITAKDAYTSPAKIGKTAAAVGEGTGWLNASIDFVGYNVNWNNTNTLDKGSNLALIMGGSGTAYVDDIVVTKRHNVVAEENFGTHSTESTGAFTRVTESTDSLSENVKAGITGEAGKWSTTVGVGTYYGTTLYRNTESNTKAALTEGEKYRLIFDYYVESKTTDLRVMLGTGTQFTNSAPLVSEKNGDYTKYQYLAITEVSSEWKTGILDVTAYALSGHNLDTIRLVMSGSGVMYIDNVKVLKKDKITYVNEGGEEITPTYGLTGETITLPAAPTKPNYRFMGWYKEAEGVNIADTVYNGDTTVYAKWKYVGNIIVDDDMTGYNYNEGKYASSSKGYGFNRVSAGDNTYIEYYSGSEYETVFATFPMYKPESTTTKATIEKQREYRMTFRYKVTELAKGKEFKFTPMLGDNLWGTVQLRTAEGADQGMSEEIATAISGEWVEATLDFYTINAFADAVDETDVGDNLVIALGVKGNGRVQIDDVKVIAKRKVTYVPNMGNDVELLNTWGVYGEKIDYTLPIMANNLFAGWHSDEALTVTAPEIYAENDIMVYGDWLGVQNQSGTCFKFDEADSLKSGSFYTNDGIIMNYQSGGFEIVNGALTISNNSESTVTKSIILSNANGIFQFKPNHHYDISYKINTTANASASLAGVVGITANGLVTADVSEVTLNGDIATQIFEGPTQYSNGDIIYYPYLTLTCTLPANSSVTVDDILIKETFTVIVKANGGTLANGKQSNTYSYESGAVFTLNEEAPTYSGHSFAGWYYGDYNTNITNGGTITVTKNTVIYADWLVNGLYADPNADGKLNVSDVLRVKRVKANIITDEYSSDRALVAETQDDSIKAIRDSLLGNAVTALNDVRIAGLSLNKYALELPEAGTSYILINGFAEFKTAMKAYGVAETATTGQPTIKAVIASSMDVNKYKFEVDANGITVTAGSSEALVGGLNRFVHIIGEAKDNTKDLHLDNGYAADVTFEALDKEFSITFSEEFEGELDRSIWGDPDILYHGTTTYIDENGNEAIGDRNITQSALAETKDGNANLVARAYKNNGRQSFTGVSISTKDTMQYQYGYLEVRAKLGSHPTTNSIWLKTFGSQQEYFSEVDILENHSTDDQNDMKFATNIHTWETGGGEDPEKNHRGSGNNWVYGTDESGEPINGEESLASDYHTYGLRWTPEEYIFYFDGVEYYRITFEDYMNKYVTAENWWAQKPKVTIDTFRQPMSLIMSNGIAGTNYGPIFDMRTDENAKGDYLIDYVRISQCGADGGSMQINPRSTTEINNVLSKHSEALQRYGLN